MKGTPDYTWTGGVFLESFCEYLKEAGFNASLRPHPNSACRWISVRMPGTRRTDIIINSLDDVLVHAAAPPKLAKHRGVDSEDGGWAFDLRDPKSIDKIIKLLEKLCSTPSKNS
jgi:hypothetical protein